MAGPASVSLPIIILPRWLWPLVGLVAEPPVTLLVSVWGCCGLEVKCLSQDHMLEPLSPQMVFGDIVELFVSSTTWRQYATVGLGTLQGHFASVPAHYG